AAIAMHRGGGCSLKQKTLNPQRRVAAAVIEHRYRHLRLDGVLPYRCRASIPACHFFAADGGACPTRFPCAERIQLVGRNCAEPGKDLAARRSVRLTSVRCYKKLRFKLTALSSSAKYSAREISTAPN